MTAVQLFRLAAVAAIAGGLLRIAVAFPIFSDPVTLEWLYTGIDVLLLFGVIGIYLDRFERLGFLGLASFAVAVAALSFIGGPDADTLGFSTYEQGAVTLAIAMVGLSIAWVRQGEQPLGPALCWFGSVVCVGVLELAPLPQSCGFIGAGVLFGAGFAWAGYALFSSRGGRAGARA